MRQPKDESYFSGLRISNTNKVSPFRRHLLLYEWKKRGNYFHLLMYFILTGQSGRSDYKQTIRIEKMPSLQSHCAVIFRLTLRRRLM